jgi:transposase
MDRHEKRRLEKAARKTKDKVLYQRIQMVLLRGEGKTQHEIIKTVGTSRSTLNRVVLSYKQEGLIGLERKPVNARRRENLTLEEEKKLIAQFAHAAGAGELLTISAIQAAYEKAIGHTTSGSTIYALLARHGWRKLMPRPHHPQRNLEAQRYFKKKISKGSGKGQTRSQGRWQAT